MNDGTIIKVGAMCIVAAVALGCLYLNRSDGILTVVAGFAAGLFAGQSIEKSKLASKEAKK